MNNMKIDVFNECFSKINDPRSHINKLHELNEILIISVTAVICGADTWKQIEEFAKNKEPFLKQFLDLPNGVPSDDTINRVVSSIDAKEFEKSFVQWVNRILQADEMSVEVIAIDGKTVRGAKSYGEKSPIHIVSAWASNQNMVIGQVKVEDKSNEITAIPELLDLLFIEGDIVTIDAMGTQTAIASKIIERGADYILAVKDNQKELRQAVEDEFRFNKAKAVATHLDFGHGRIETRACSVISDFKFIKNEDDKWLELKQIVKIESIREFKNSPRKTEKETRYYITSLEKPAEDIQRYIRSHWGVENKLHWVLDMVFTEDYSRKRFENAAQNFSIITKIALNLLKGDKKTKQGLQGKRLKAAWNEDYLKEILKIKV